MKKWKTLRAQKMRSNPTTAEAAAWAKLRTLRDSHGLRFRHQHPCLGFILDFYCPARRLCIEIDGGYHAFRAAQDARRDRIISEGMSIRTIRFQNAEVFKDEWLATVAAIALARPVAASWRQEYPRTA